MILQNIKLSSSFNALNMAKVRDGSGSLTGFEIDGGCVLILPLAMPEGEQADRVVSIIRDAVSVHNGVTPVL